MPDGVVPEPMQSLSDEGLMAIVQAKDDAQAFAELVARWQTQLIGLCFRLTGNHQDAEEAVQTTFAKAYLSRQQFLGTGKFSTWLWRIAINAAHDISRSRRSTDTDEEVNNLRDVSDGPAAATEQTEQQELVRQAIAQLSEQHRTVLILRHYEQLRFREIADVLDIPRGTVASRMAEALNQLGKILSRSSKEL